MSKKVIGLDKASGLDLKAEIAAQEAKFAKHRANFEGQHVRPIKRALDKSKYEIRNKGIDKRNLRDKSYASSSLDAETSDAIELSKIALKKKAKIYQQLLKEGKEFDDADENTLIDFESKKFDGEYSAYFDEDSDFIQGGSSNEKKVEIVDEFGRTRLVDKEEIHEYIPPKEENEYIPGLVSADMLREMERQKWEKEMEEEAKGPLHYDARKEYRAQGVGHYQFSRDEEERMRQMAELKKIREETESKRAEHRTIFVKRYLTLCERLERINCERDQFITSSGHYKDAKMPDFPKVDDDVNSFINQFRPSNF